MTVWIDSFIVSSIIICLSLMFYAKFAIIRERIITEVITGILMVLLTVVFTVHTDKDISVNTMEELGDSLILKPGETFLIATKSLKSDHSQKLIYSSSSPRVATVTDDGLITAFVAGETTIEIKDGDDLIKQSNIHVEINILEKIYLDAPIFRIDAVKAADGNYSSIGQGFTVTPDYYVACTIQKSSTEREYATINLYNRSDNTLFRQFTFHKLLGHGNDLGYNPETGDIIISGTDNAFSVKQLLEGNIEYNEKIRVGRYLSSIDYDPYTDQYYLLVSNEVDGISRMQILVYDSDLKTQLNTIDVVITGSQGLGSYKGKVLYPHFKSKDRYGNKNPEDSEDIYYFRNGLDIYRASTGEYLGTYLFVAPVGTVEYNNQYSEIEDIVWSGEGNKFYIFYSSRHVFEVELEVPE